MLSEATKAFLAYCFLQETTELGGGEPPDGLCANTTGLAILAGMVSAPCITMSRALLRLDTPRRLCQGNSASTFIPHGATTKECEPMGAGIHFRQELPSAHRRNLLRIPSLCIDWRLRVYMKTASGADSTSSCAQLSHLQRSAVITQAEANRDPRDGT